MEPLGQFLKRQRELREITIAKISQETKIAPNWLDAIESDKWETLPGKAFTKGFLRAYARAVGLDPDEIALRFESIVKPENNNTKGMRKGIGQFKKQTLLTVVVVLAVLIFLIWFVSSH